MACRSDHRTAIKPTAEIKNMLKRLLFVSAVLLPIGANATPMDQANAVAFAGEALKACLQKQGTTAEYCGCFAQTAATKSTMEDGIYYLTYKKFPSDYSERVISASVAHCTKQWWQVWK
jgi:hypothetical protein